MPPSIRGLPFAAALLWATSSAAATPDWEALREVGTVKVVTADPDGESRETKVWLVVFDGAGIVRTGNTTWGDNVVRNRELVLRVGDASYPLRVEFVEDDAERKRIADAFREKYGFSDAMVSWMRGAHPKLMRLVPKE